MTDELPLLPDDVGPPGLGLDVESLARWRELVQDTIAWGRLQRSFTRAERAELDAAPDTAVAAAGRWVAKEAVVKAAPGRHGLRDVEVLRGPSGGLEVRRPTLPGLRVHVSVSHTHDHVFGAAWTTPGKDHRMLRSARRDDAETVLAWRNHPRVRAASFTTGEIELGQHLAWWERVQQDESRHLYVFEHDGRPSGVVHYDVEDDGRAIWGFYLDLEGLGDGPELLRAWGQVFEEGIRLAFDDLGVTSLEGEVLVENGGVRALHHRYGFEESEPYDRDVDGTTKRAVHMRLTPELRRGRRG